jgi:hypothetical protein
MHEKRTLISSSNSKILSTLEDLYYTNTEVKVDQLDEVLASLQDWSQEQAALQFASQEEKENHQNYLLAEIEATLKIYLYFTRNLPDFDKNVIETICNAGLISTLQLMDKEFLVQYVQDTEDAILNTFDFPILEGNIDLKTRVFISHVMVHGCVHKIEELGWPLDYPKSELDLQFLDKHFDWNITENDDREWSNGQSNEVHIVKAKDSKKGLFTFGFIYENSLPKYVDVVFKYSPFPHATFDLFLAALAASKVKFTENNNGWIRLEDISSKEKLALASEVLLRFSRMNEEVIAKLDSMIGCIDPTKELNKLIEIKEYDKAIERAAKGVERGFKDCMWNLAETLQNKCVFDMAFLAFNSIDKKDPSYKDAKLKCFHIIEQVLFAGGLSEEEIIENKENQFILLSELCQIDKTETQYEIFKDSLYSELCGNTGNGIYGRVSKIAPNVDTLVTLAREMRQMKQLYKILENENKTLKEQIEVLKPIKNTSATVAPQKFFATANTTSTTTTISTTGISKSGR